MTPDEIRTALAALGSKRATARADLRATSADIAALAKPARAAGLQKTEIAALAQISRPALDDMLKR